MSPIERARALWRWARGQTDGCTAAPDLAWHRCCAPHDADYRTHTDEEGRPLTRAQADRRLLLCMRREALTPIGRHLLAWCYYVAVRLFGRAYWRRGG